MKKSWVVAGLLLLAGFVAATWLRFSGAGDGPVVESREIDRDRIRSFWSAYHAATESRIRGDYLHAADSYLEALEIDPTHEESLYYLGNSQLELGRFEQAEQTYRRLSLLNPSSQRAFSQLGAVTSTLRPGARVDWEQARNAFQRCIEINPEESGPFIRLGLLSLQLRELGEAERYFQTAAGFRSLEGIFLTGFAASLRDRHDDAVESFVRVLELGEHEARISGRGVKSEGDVRSTPTGPLTPVEGAQAKARAHLFWTAARLGGYPADVPAAFRLLSSADKKLAARPSLPRVRGGGTPAWVDFDADGDLDLAVSGGDRDALALYRNHDGKLESVSSGLPPGTRGSDQVWGDSDGDGDPDLLLIRSQWGTPSPPVLYRNAGAGQSPLFTESTALRRLTNLQDVDRGHFWDYDNNGTRDLVLASGSAHVPLIFLRNSGQGEFSPDPRPQLPPIEGPATDLLVGDLNQDGREDLVLMRWRRPPVLLLNEGGGRFRDVTSDFGMHETSAPGFRASLLDYDQDGDLDLLMSGFSPYDSALLGIFDPDAVSAVSGPRLFSNHGGESFEEVTSQSGLPAAASTMAIAVADLNRDGFPDLIFAEGGPEMDRLLPSAVFINRQGRFDPPRWLPAIDRPANSSGVAAADWDGDGHFEVFLSGVGLFSIDF